MTKKTNTQPEETEEENYLVYENEKIIIIAKDNAVINISNIMSGQPRENPPKPPGGG